MIYSIHTFIQCFLSFSIAEFIFRYFENQWKMWNNSCENGDENGDQSQKPSGITEPFKKDPNGRERGKEGPMKRNHGGHRLENARGKKNLVYRHIKMDRLTEDQPKYWVAPTHWKKKRIKMNMILEYLSKLIRFKQQDQNSNSHLANLRRGVLEKRSFRRFVTSNDTDAWPFFDRWILRERIAEQQSDGRTAGSFN